MPSRLAQYPGRTRLPGSPRRGFGRLGLIVGLPLLVSLGMGAGPADPLFRLVPPESSVVLAVEDLRDGARRVEAAAITEDLKRLPLVATWLASDRVRRFQRIEERLEVSLGVPIRTLRDEILGDAFVLALLSGPDDKVDRSSGLLLIKPRQPKLLAQLIETRNAAATKQGSLLVVDVRRHGPTTYQSRLRKPGAGPSDHYILFEDGTFAWSNSEATIHEVIDRRLGARPGWGSLPTSNRLRLGLPDHALASLFVAPSVVNQVLTATRPATSPEHRYFNKVAAVYLKAVAATGLAIEWRDGLFLQTHDILDPARLPPWMAAWMGRPAQVPPLVGSLSPSVCGVISARFDYLAALRAVRLLVDEEDQLAWQSAEQAAQGLALGQPLENLLAQVDPHLLITLEPRTSAESRSWLTITGGTTWLKGGRPDDHPWLAVDNAFRTGMAMYACRPLRRAQFYRLASPVINGRTVTELGPPDRSVLAFESQPDRLVVSTSAAAVGAFARGGEAATAVSPLMTLREQHAAHAETFAIFDLPRLADAVVQSRKLIVRDLATRSNRTVAEVDRDLGNVLALANLFRAAVFTSNAGNDATEIHRTIGLIAR